MGAARSLPRTAPPPDTGADDANDVARMRDRQRHALESRLYCSESPGRPMPRRGIFLPDWLVSATGSEARAAVFCAINSRYAERAGRQLYRYYQYVYAAISPDHLVRQLSLPWRTVMAALRWFIDKGWIAVVPPHDGRPPGYAIQPLPVTSALHEWFKAHPSKSPPPGLTFQPLETCPAEDWMACENRKSAFRVGIPGITLHLGLRTICDGDLAIARLLGQIIYRCAGKFPAWRVTMPELAASLGCSERTAQRLRDHLVAQRFLVLTHQKAKRGGQVRRVCALAPNYAELLRVLPAAGEPELADTGIGDAGDAAPDAADAELFNIA